MDYHIAREGQQLGIYSESQVHENLLNGTFSLADVAWSEGMTEWKLLSELFPEKPVETPPLPPRQVSAMPSPITGVSKTTSGLAITSLVCSILSYFTCFITGIPAIVCGHLALSKIKKSGGTIGGKGLAIGGLIVTYLSLILIILIMIGIGLPAYKKGADRAKSMINARQIVLACKTYASKHEGKYPETLEALVEEGALKKEAISNFEYLGAAIKDGDQPGSIVLMSRSTGTGGKKIIARDDGSVAEEAPPLH